MATLYTTEGYNQLLQRLDKLTPDTQRQWGKMEPAQMLAHVRGPIDVALGKVQLPKSFFMKLFGGIIRKQFMNGKPIKKNSPTAPILKITDQRDFATEKANFLQSIKEFTDRGRANQLPPAHIYFGKMTADEWSQFQQTHINHHFTQFGV